MQLPILPRGHSLQTEESLQTGILRQRTTVSEKVSAVYSKDVLELWSWGSPVGLESGVGACVSATKL